ncbi:hypothetical protein D918_03879 [Trichuris suis]|nr:hypothetical protein D918_03879 [Trichuris suis]
MLDHVGNLSETTLLIAMLWLFCDDSQRVSDGTREFGVRRFPRRDDNVQRSAGANTSNGRDNNWRIGDLRDVGVDFAQLFEETREKGFRTVATDENSGSGSELKRDFPIEENGFKLARKGFNRRAVVEVGIQAKADCADMSVGTTSTFEVQHSIDPAQ